MATEPIALDKGLSDVVERARAGLSEGDLPIRSEAAQHGLLGLDDDGRAAVLRVLRDGTYARAVAAVAAEDPDLAD
jgi:hypothetical protein